MFLNLCEHGSCDLLAKYVGVTEIKSMNQQTKQRFVYL